MSGAAIKAVAMLAMLLDHLGMVCGFPELRVIGRLGFPLFAFGVAEGWCRTHDRRAYFLRMARFAGISQIPFILALSPGPWHGWHDSSGLTAMTQGPWFLLFAILASFGILGLCRPRRASDWAGLVPALVLPGIMLRYGDPGRWILYPAYNVFYTFACSLAVLYLWNIWIRKEDSSRGERGFAVGGSIFAVIGCVFYGSLADYSFLGVFLPLCLYLAGRGRKYGRYLQVLVLAIWSVIVYNESIVYLAAAASSAILVLLYRPDRGPGPAWFRRFGYWFYPAHLAALGILRILA